MGSSRLVGFGGWGEPARLGWLGAGVRQFEAELLGAGRVRIWRCDVRAQRATRFAHELTHWLERRRRRVSRDAELRKAPGLRHHLALERADRRVVRIDRA